MPRRYVLALLGVSLLLGCARENPLFGLDGGESETETGGEPVAVGETSGGMSGGGNDTVAGATDGTGAGGSAEATGGTDSGAASDADSDTADTDAAPEDGSGSDDAGGGAWDESCRTEAASRPCPFVVDGPVSCIAGPTAPVPTGCGDFEEHRVTVALSEGGNFVIGLLDPGAVLAGPDARLGIVGIAETLEACVDGAPPISGPIVEVALAASNYDAIITASQPAVTTPFVVRETSTLCPVDASCCDPDPAVECDEPGLVGCVAALDPFCANESWDALCVDLGVAACGAACPLS